MQTESGKSILLVEDMAIIAMAEANTLKKNGFNVKVAYNGNEAIKIASENPNLDLILMDIDLGKGMDGTEAAQIILKTHDIPIVFLSNHTEKEIVEKTEKITSYGYVVKNSGETVLIASIKMAFKLFDAHRLRLESENKLLESDHKFHTLEKQIDDVIWTMDMNFRFTYISPSVEKMHGYTVDEMMKLNLQDYLTEESAQKAIDVLGEEISAYLKDKIEKNIVTIEIDQRKKDGTVFPTEIRARFLLDEHGLPSGIIGVSRDISKRYLAEKALRDSEKTLNLALEGAQIGLWDQNFKTGKVLRSDLWATMLGYQPEELDSSIDFWKSHIHPDDLPATLVEAAKHEQGLTEFFKVQHRLKCKNGNYKWILNWGKISERDEEGKPVRALGIHLDIDEHRQIEESLKLSEERLRYALEGNSDGIWDWNLKTGAVYFSPHYYTMLGYQPNEFLPSYEKWKEFLHPDDLVKSETTILSAIEMLNSFSVEFRLRKKDGSYCWILSRGKVAEKDSDGKALRISGSHSDINERKLAEEVLKKNENKLNSIFKAAPIGIGVTSNRVLLEVNDTTCKMLGYNCDELIGNSALMLYPTKEDYEFVGNEKYEQIKKYGTGTVETKWKRKDGKMIDVLLSSTPLNLKDISGGVTFTALDISERKKMEEALRVSLTKFQVLFESFPLGITISGKTGNIIESNTAAERLLGLSSVEHKLRQIDSGEWKIINTNGSTMLPDEYASVRALKENRLVENVQMGIVKSKDDITWINVTAAPIPLEDFGVAIAYGDITELKKGEEELKRNEQMFRQFFNVSPDAIFLLREDGKFIDANQVALDRYGYTIDELINMTPINLAPDNLHYEASNKIKLALENELNFEWVHRKKDGTEFPVQIHSKPIILKGKPSIFVEVRDITEFKKNELALKSSEERYSLAQKAGNIGSWDWNLQSNELKWSELVSSMFGFKAGEFNGTIDDFWNRLHPDDIPVIQEKIKATIENNEDYIVEHRIIFPDGSIKWMLETGKVFKDKFQKPFRMLGMVQDITERKLAEKEILQRKEELERFEKIVVGRELKMIELKEKLTEMEQRLKEYQKNVH